MEANMVLFMNELSSSQPKWSLESAQIICRMREIAQMVESLKFNLKATQLTRGRFGTHFIECMWSNPNITAGPDTCTCTLIRIYMYEFKQLFKKLDHNECGEETYNKFMATVSIL